MHACIVAKQSCRLPKVSMIGAHLAHVYGSGRRRRRGLRVGRDNGAHVRGTGPSVRLHPQLLRARNSRSSPADVLDTIRTIANVGWWRLLPPQQNADAFPSLPLPERAHLSPQSA